MPQNLPSYAEIHASIARQPNMTPAQVNQAVMDRLLAEYKEYVVEQRKEKKEEKSFVEYLYNLRAFPVKQSIEIKGREFNFATSSEDPVNFNGCTFVECRFISTGKAKGPALDFQAATFKRCKFVATQSSEVVEWVNFRQATFTDLTEFSQFRIRNANFTQATFNGVSFNACALRANNWKNATFINMVAVSNGNGAATILSGYWGGAIFDTIRGEDLTIRGKVVPTFLGGAAKAHSVWTYDQEEKNFKQKLWQPDGVMSAIVLVGLIAMIGAVWIGGMVPLITIGVTFVIGFGVKTWIAHYNEQQIAHYKKNWKEDSVSAAAVVSLEQAKQQRMEPLHAMPVAVPYDRPLLATKWSAKQFMAYLHQLGEQCNQLIKESPQKKGKDRVRLSIAIDELYMAIKHARHYIEQQDPAQVETLQKESLAFLQAMKEKCIQLTAGNTVLPFEQKSLDGLLQMQVPSVQTESGQVNRGKR